MDMLFFAFTVVILKHPSFIECQILLPDFGQIGGPVEPILEEGAFIFFACLFEKDYLKSARGESQNGHDKMHALPKIVLYSKE